MHRGLADTTDRVPAAGGRGALERLGRIAFITFGWAAVPWLPARASGLSVASGAGLRIGISTSGVISRVEIGGRRVDGGGSGGFFLGLGGAKEAAHASAEAAGKSVRLRLGWPERGVSGTASVTGSPLGVAVHGDVVGTSEKERAITLTFELPLGPEAASTWWDDIDRSRPVSGDGVLENVLKTPAGATGTHSPYPLACVSGSSAVAMGIPLDRPVIHRFSYSSSSGRLGVSFDFALTAAARRFSSRASFDFVIFPVDPTWGFRSALERYYAIFPEAFERCVPRIGGWVAFGNLKSVPGFSDYGFRFHWGPNPSSLAFDGAHGIYTFLYSDSARYFSDLGSFDRKPDRQEAARVFHELIDSADPRGIVLGRPESATGRRRFEGLEEEMGAEKAGSWLRKALSAVRISATTDAAGEFNVGFILNKKEWGPENWWTGRLFCNLDPALPGGYGEFLLEDLLGRSLPSASAVGASYEGVALDNYFVDGNTLDFRPEHIAASEIPLTFSHENLRPVVPGDFSMYLWTRELSKRLRAQGGWVMANAVSIPYPFAASLLDIHGYEVNLMDLAPLARALAHHKPVVSLPVKPEHYEEPFLRKHVRFGFVPGGYADKRFATDEALRALYRLYVPALVRCAEAGWEPVTGAVSDNAAVKVERFGRPGAPILLSVTNDSESVQTGRIRLEPGRLRLPLSASRTTDLISGRTVSWKPERGALVTSIQLVAGEALVLDLAR